MVLTMHITYNLKLCFLVRTVTDCNLSNTLLCTLMFVFSDFFQLISYPTFFAYYIIYNNLKDEVN